MPCNLIKALSVVVSKLWANLKPNECEQRVGRATDGCDSMLDGNRSPIAFAIDASIADDNPFHAGALGLWTIWMVAILVAATVGCANWHKDADLAKTVRGFPAPRRHPGDVILDVSFVSIRPTRPPAALKSDSITADFDAIEVTPEADRNADYDTLPSPSDLTDEMVIDIWKSIDETVVIPESRSALRRNGIRMGKAQSVADFSRQLEKIRVLPTESSEVLEVADVQSDLSHSARRITFRVGKRYELPVRQVSKDAQVMLVALGDQTLGQTLSQAQPLFAMRVSSADARTVRLQLRPEVQHGAMVQTWVGNEAALRIENRREAWILSELETDVSLEKGDVLVAGCRDPAFGLGKHLFTGTTAEGDSDQVLMIVKVVELPDTIIVNAQ